MRPSTPTRGELSERLVGGGPAAGFPACPRAMTRTARVLAGYPRDRSREPQRDAGSRAVRPPREPGPDAGGRSTEAPLSDPEPSLRRDRRTGRSLRVPRPRHRARWQGGDASGQIRRPERPRLAAASARRVACHPRPGLARPASPDGGFAPPTQESSALSIDCGRALVSRRGGRSRRIGRCCPFERGPG